MNKPKKLISLAILPVMALAGCDGNHKTKVAPSSKTTTKNANGAYQKCDPNQSDCQSSGGSGGGGTYAGSGGHLSADDGKSGSKSSSKGGFGGSAGHSGG